MIIISLSELQYCDLCFEVTDRMVVQTQTRTPFILCVTHSKVISKLLETNPFVDTQHLINYLNKVGLPAEFDPCAWEEQQLVPYNTRLALDITTKIDAIDFLNLSGFKCVICGGKQEFVLKDNIKTYPLCTHHAMKGFKYNNLHTALKTLMLIRHYD